MEGKAAAATIRRLAPDEVAAVLEAWRGESEPQTDRMRQALQEWDWSRIARMPSGRVLGLGVEGRSGTVGMAAVTLRGKTRAGRSCVGVVFLAKSPSAFLGARVSGVGRALIVEAVRLSVRYRMHGRVRIRQALREEGGYDPSRLYRELGFEDAGTADVGVEWDDLELSASGAERLLAEDEVGR